MWQTFGLPLSRTTTLVRPWSAARRKGPWYHDTPWEPSPQAVGGRRMEDVNRFARELADAIAAAVAEHPQVEACRERARAAGYEMRVTLEAVVGFVTREKGGALTKVQAPARAVPAQRALESLRTTAGSCARSASRQTRRRRSTTSQAAGFGLDRKGLWGFPQPFFCQLPTPNSNPQARACPRFADTLEVGSWKVCV